ncbi:MAG TPA: DUF1826 domain-containing protein [Chitinophagales bacterium]|nr:DUF1826 domain-containing protein [Chitinophagales bacterium]
MIGTRNYFFSNAVVGTSPDILHDIHKEEKNICIYERDTFHFQNALEHFLQSEIEFSYSGSVKEIEIALKEPLDSCLPLFEDVMQTLELFQIVSQAKSFRLLLATVNTNMCRRFHTDINDLRLLCTYYGQGTLWLPEEIVNRDALDTCGDDACVITNDILIQQVAPGNIAIIKGTIYPKRGTKACVHRSPTIEESGEKRLLLRIDTNEFLNFLE